MSSAFDQGLAKNAANHVALSPIDYLARSALVYGPKLAIVHGPVRQTWAQTYDRCKRFASSLSQMGIGKNDTVATLLYNTPAMVEAHFSVPMNGSVLSTLNTRLELPDLIYCLRHGEAKALLLDGEFAHHVPALRAALPKLTIIQVNDAEGPQNVAPFGDAEYEDCVAQGDPDFAWAMPADEWDAIALNYTSGTTGQPKGVVYHHRGAALNALSNILEWDMPKHPVYLWTLPMFHCNGWCFPWTIAARAGVNVCLRKFDPVHCLNLIRQEQVSHYSAAPIVHSGFANASAADKAGIGHTVRGMIAGAPPPESTLTQLEAMGFDITHVYGLTEVYGPASVCVAHPEWQDLAPAQRSERKARQGVRYHMQADLAVIDPLTMQPVPQDGVSVGELMFRGNICMKGYFKDADATADSFAGGWFHTGDIGVWDADSYVKITDRSKDIIISGGENISSIELENVLYNHPSILACAVVAAPDAKWGEVPFAFIETKEDATVTAEELRVFCRDHLAGFKVPKAFEFGELPKTATNKIQKNELRKIAVQKHPA
ncbi:MAG: acyl-CoA synthetase [Neisseriaceae bacterium]|nr:acyl-CoA synthetase [Neisseriaceae bacterium]